MLKFLRRNREPKPTPTEVDREIEAQQKKAQELVAELGIIYQRQAAVYERIKKEHE